MKKFFVVLVLSVVSALVVPFGAFASGPVGAEADTLFTYLDPISVTAIKQGMSLKGEALSSTVLGANDIAGKQITAMKNVSQIAPNFYIPDYGSRITSSIYVRGLGARIDQPVVGLNIDNVPFINKNAFDLEVMDIERMEILRGPASVLYGRNTMGGLVNIYTLSPFNFQGVKVGADYSTGNTYNVRASVYHKFSEKFAASLGLYKSGSDGFYTNLYSGEKCEQENSAGGRLKLQFRPSEKLRIENTLSVSTLKQDGYAYMNLETSEINYNDPSNYYRTVINDGLTVSYSGEGWTLSSITAYQYLDDSMTLDQDFSTQSMFTLTQAIQDHAISQDLVFKSSKDEHGYNYLFGLFGFYDNKKMQAPVRFKEDGIEYLIYDNVNGSNGYYSDWEDNSFDLNSDFTNHTFGAAIYHSSTYSTERFEVNASLRLDFEKTILDYHSYMDSGCWGNITDSEGNITNSFYKDLDIDLTGTPSQHFFELLPKISALYRFGDGYLSTLYGSISKGYKAGGYNSQMFSDILQQELMKKFGVSAAYSPEDIISYLPEYSWNYEIGMHLQNSEGSLSADVSLFYIDCIDQQLTVFPDDMITGRLMTNAGHSRSFGAEVSGRAVLGNFFINVSYGYTNAKFITYDDNEEDYAGNYLPYAPQHTLYANIEYQIPINTKFLNTITVGVNTNGAGKIYWNESNTLSQPFYALLGAEVRFEAAKYSVALWGRNICDKEYYTFYFMSMGNEFVQQAKPQTFGISLNLQF
ncbi:MAG: TonB-dependent receptor [Rikenellaceae bacterium]